MITKALKVLEFVVRAERDCQLSRLGADHAG